MADNKNVSLKSLLKDADTLPITERAILYATVKHAGVERKGMKVPYITHVMEAMEVVSRITDNDEIRAAAVLHDTLEDTNATVGELTELFGPVVASLVMLATEDKRKDQPAEDTWKIRKKESLDHLKLSGTAAKMVALGDKLSNIRDMYQDYMVMGDKLWNKFNQKDPAEQEWYYREMRDIFSSDEEISRSQAYQEYCFLLNKVFSGNQ